MSFCKLKFSRLVENDPIKEMLTNGISIKFQIRPNFAVLWFKTCSTDRNEM